MVRDTLVVPAWRNRDHAAGHHAGDGADNTAGHDDEASATDTGRFDETSASGGHVFCLTASVDEDRVSGAAT